VWYDLTLFTVFLRIVSTLNSFHTCMHCRNYSFMNLTLCIHKGKLKVNTVCIYYLCHIIFWSGLSSLEYWLTKIYTTIGIDWCTLCVDSTSITAKLYILQKFCHQGICSKFLGFWHGRGYFLTSEVIEAVRGQKRPKSLLRRVKKLEGVNCLEHLFNKSCLSTSTTP